MNISTKIAAFLVHILTASGILTGFMAILAINRSDWREGMMWLLVYLIIDGIDGSLARAVQVKKVLPNYDGKSIDDLSDYTNFVLVPVYFFYQADMVGGWLEVFCVVVMLVSTAVYYGKEDVVSNDYYFLGFTGMWNMVIFFLFFIFQFPSWLNAIIILLLALFQFLPIKFVYPSRQKRYKGFTMIVSCLLIVSMVAILWVFPYRPNWLLLVPILALLYYAAISVALTFLDKE